MQTTIQVFEHLLGMSDNAKNHTNTLKLIFENIKIVTY